MGGFWSIGRVVLLAGLGLGVGLRSATRSPRWLGYLAVMSNGLVVLLYGFLLVFFGLGGSR